MLTILTQTQWSDLQQISYNKNINLLLIINFAFLQTKNNQQQQGKKHLLMETLCLLALS